MGVKIGGYLWAMRQKEEEVPLGSRTVSSVVLIVGTALHLREFVYFLRIVQGKCARRRRHQKTSEQGAIGFFLHQLVETILTPIDGRIMQVGQRWIACQLRQV